MADEKKQNQADELNAVRNRARMERMIKNSGNLALRPTASEEGVGQVAQDRAYDAMGQINQGEQINPLQQQALAAKLQADRIRATRARQIERDEKQAKKKAGQGERDKDYPNPIKFRQYVGFGIVALGQDLLPLIFDLLAIGWIIEYCLLPITWGAYWTLIVRWTPRSLRRKFWSRTILVTAAGWIPVLGQFLPEWTATAVGAYVVMSLYERRKAALAAGKRARQARGGQKDDSVAPAAASAGTPSLAGAPATAASAAQTLPR